MVKIYIGLLLIFGLFLNFSNLLLADNNFFEEGKKKYLEKNYDESKFLFQRSIVFNPKDANSYLYLAKIYNSENNKKEEEKNAVNSGHFVPFQGTEALEPKGIFIFFSYS